MTRTHALAIGRRVQLHPYGGRSLAERVADEVMAAYKLGEDIAFDDQFTEEEEARRLEAEEETN